MSFWTAVVIIVAIGAIASVLRSRYNAQTGIIEDHHGNQTLMRSDDPDRKVREQAAQAEIAALKDRIAVLERIATDANSDEARESKRIASEIEALRAAGRPSETITSTGGQPD